MYLSFFRKKREICLNVIKYKQLIMIIIMDHREGEPFYAIQVLGIIRKNNKKLE